MSTELRVENYSLEKNNMLTNHDSNRNRNMSRIDEGKESETNEDKQKNEVRDAFTTTDAFIDLVVSPRHFMNFCSVSLGRGFVSTSAMLSDVRVY